MLTFLRTSNMFEPLAVWKNNNHTVKKGNAGASLAFVISHYLAYRFIFNAVRVLSFDTVSMMLTSPDSGTVQDEQRVLGERGERERRTLKAYPPISSCSWCLSN